jgi:hypothetical protein
MRDGPTVVKMPPPDAILVLSSKCLWVVNKRLLIFSFFWLKKEKYFFKNKINKNKVGNELDPKPHTK